MHLCQSLKIIAQEEEAAVAAAAVVVVVDHVAPWRLLRPGKRSWKNCYCYFQEKLLSQMHSQKRVLMLQRILVLPSLVITENHCNCVPILITW